MIELRLLIGSSNVARFFDAKTFLLHEVTKFEKCARSEEFRVKMTFLNKEMNLETVAISVICKHCKSE